MNNLYSKLTTLAAAVALAAGSASAQTHGLKAAVPFPFTVATGKVMPAGDYTVSNERSVWKVQGNQSVVVPLSVAQTSKDSETPKLVFECRGHNCRLSRIQVGGGELGAYWPAPRNKAGNGETARLVVVPLLAS
jgi:hypothetical protein